MAKNKKNRLPMTDLKILLDPEAHWVSLSFRPRVRREFGQGQQALAEARLDAAERNALVYAYAGGAMIGAHCPDDFDPYG